MYEEIPKSNNKDNLKTVRTYLSDMADTVRENDISVIKVALAEQNKHEREDLFRKAEGTPVTRTIWIIGGIVLVLVSITGTYYVIQKKVKDNVPVVVAKEETIITYDGTSSVEINNTDYLVDKLKNHIKQLSTSTTTNGINSIEINQKINNVSAKLKVVDLFSRLNLNAPASLVRSLSDLYMVGTYTKNATSDPKLFLIFRSNEYDYTYAGMLEWENFLSSDMFYLFNLKTNENKLQLETRKWKDIIINNRDARVLYNEENKPILYYMFADSNSLVITDNEEAIKEITTRLIIKNVKPL
ncbi:MAG: hypothetical protein WCI91_03795 [Candidatus Nomurabacteria bacterium]